MTLQRRKKRLPPFGLLMLSLLLLLALGLWLFLLGLTLPPFVLHFPKMI